VAAANELQDEEVQDEEVSLTAWHAEQGITQGKCLCLQTLPFAQCMCVCVCVCFQVDMGREEWPPKMLGSVTPCVSNAMCQYTVRTCVSNTICPPLPFITKSWPLLPRARPLVCTQQARYAHCCSSLSRRTRKPSNQILPSTPTLPHTTLKQRHGQFRVCHRSRGACNDAAGVLHPMSCVVCRIQCRLLHPMCAACNVWCMQ
jgi:hypothetical protein